MRIVSWNCNGAFRKKLGALIALDADVCVIQECEDPARCEDPEYKAWASNFLWVGTNKNRGLGVFAKQGISLEQVGLDSGPLELFLPCIVAGNISLLAVWTRQANSPTFRYIGQLWKYLQQHREFLRHEQAVCIGDLNSNACWDVWDRWWNHSDVLKELQDVGLESVYHFARAEAQGQESRPTFFMHRQPEKPYHIDYAFLSQALLRDAAVEIGEPNEWLEYSDHMPLIVRIMANSNVMPIFKSI